MTGKYKKPKVKCVICSKFHIKEKMIQFDCGHYGCSDKLVNRCQIEFLMKIIENRLLWNDEGRCTGSIHIYDTSMCPLCRSDYESGGGRGIKPITPFVK